MTVLAETIKTATVLNAHGENGVWEKTKTHTNNRNGELNTRGITKKEIISDWKKAWKIQRGYHDCLSV